MWNSIFLPSTTSPPKDLRPKHSSLSRAIFRRCPRPPYLFSQVGVRDPRRKKRLKVFIRGAFVEAAIDWAAPTNRNTGDGWWVSRPYKSQHRGRLVIEPPLQIGAMYTGAFVGAAQSPAAPTNDPRIKNCSPFFLLGALTPTHEKKVGRPWAPPKNCSTKRGKVLVLNPLVERL